MKIALTITELHPGGAEKCCVELAEYLHQAHHQVAVWQLWGQPPPQKSLLTDRLNELGIHWYSGQARHIWHFPTVCRWLNRELASFQPDVVQAFLFHANLATALALPKSSALFFGGARVRQPERYRQWLQRLASKRMCKLVCVSQDVYDHCRQQENIDADKLAVIPNGIDVDRLDEEPSGQWSTFGLPDNARVLLYVGRLTEQKGILNLLLEVDQLLERLPQHHLVLMGEGEYRQQVEKAIHVSKFGQRIHLVGWQKAPHRWMRKSECLLLPALYEGMPNVILEAMASRIPVVCFAVEGVQELLGNERSAADQIAQRGDIKQFNELVVQLAEDQSLRDHCGTYNRNRVESKFLLETQLHKYESLYLQAAKLRSSHQLSDQ